MPFEVTILFYLSKLTIHGATCFCFKANNNQFFSVCFKQRIIVSLLYCRNMICSQLILTIFGIIIKKCLRMQLGIHMQLLNEGWGRNHSRETTNMNTSRSCSILHIIRVWQTRLHVRCFHLNVRSAVVYIR